MIELDKIYSTKVLAEVLNISYDHFRKHRKEYEEHLSKFYSYNITHKGNGIYYTKRYRVQRQTRSALEEGNSKSQIEKEKEFLFDFSNKKCYNNIETDQG